MARALNRVAWANSFTERIDRKSYPMTNLSICFMIINLSRRTPISDADIIRAIQDRNERITESFFYECKKYFMSSYKAIFCREDIKDDIFQQSFVKLWTEIETKKVFLDENNDILRIDRWGNTRNLTCSLKTFLIDIAKNDYRDWLSHDKFELQDDFESFAHMIEVHSAVMPEESYESLQEQIISSCIFDLPPRCKEILTMFYYENMSLDEIIQARGEKNTSKNGLKTGKHKCMETLKVKVKDMYNKYNLRY